MTVRAINLNHFRVKLGSVMQKEAVNAANVTSMMGKALTPASRLRRLGAENRWGEAVQRLTNKRDALANYKPTRPSQNITEEFNHRLMLKGNARKMKEVDRQLANRQAQGQVLASKSSIAPPPGFKQPQPDPGLRGRLEEYASEMDPKLLASGGRRAPATLAPATTRGSFWSRLSPFRQVAQ